MPVNTRDPAAVEAEVQSTYLALFAKGDPQMVPRAFGWAGDCFTGTFDDYQPIDAHYHDFEHTLQGTLCLARLLNGRHRAGVGPVLTQAMFELGLLAILLHDTGYLKKGGDREGTGAKYTLHHVSRSAEFADQLLRQKGFDRPAINAVQNMIRCTGVNVDLVAIPFQSELERVVGFALSTADLLGQMAAGDYVDKLPVLYEEFAESDRHYGGKSGGLGAFASARELLQKTPAFWIDHVKPKIENDFGGLYKFLNDPYPDGPNLYLDRIEANISRLRRQLEVTA